MAMIKCRECGKKISDLAEKCPHCGCPINYSLQQDPELPITAQQDKPKRKNSKLGVFALIFSLLGCTFIIGIILAIIDLSKKDGRKRTLSVIALVICGIWLLLFISDYRDSTQTPAANVVSEKTGKQETGAQSDSKKEVKDENDAEVENPTDAGESAEAEEPAETEPQDKYFVGDTWQNSRIKVTYLDCYVYTGYDEWSAPQIGNMIICAKFEFENIGDSDSFVDYGDFHGYADGYEVKQSYAPDGSLFSVKMSAGRKGTGIVAFEVPVNAYQIEIEFSPSVWTSENVIFVFE